MINHRLLACTDAQNERIATVIRRLREAMPALRFDAMRITCDLSVCQNTGTLDLARLAKANIGEVAHDVGGIWSHLDRGTGELRDGFVPRCSPTHRNGIRKLDSECDSVQLHWIVFPRAIVDPACDVSDARLAVLFQQNAEHYGLCEPETPAHAGGRFADPLVVTVSRRRVLLTQRCGYDV